MEYGKLGRLAMALLFIPSVAVAQETAEPADLRELNGTVLNEQLRERQAKIDQLPTEEQKKLQAAHRAAAKDPTVRAALEARDKAARELEATIRASMIRTDPEMAAILEKLKANGGKLF